MTWLLLAEAGVPEGGLFDLDATLPLMAVQVVLLTFLLNALFFRPVGKVVEDREGYISTSRADAKQKLAQVERCLLYTSPSPRDGLLSRMPSSA